MLEVRIPAVGLPYLELVSAGGNCILEFFGLHDILQSYKIVSPYTPCTDHANGHTGIYKMAIAECREFLFEKIRDISYLAPLFHFSEGSLFWIKRIDIEYTCTEDLDDSLAYNMPE